MHQESEIWNYQIHETQREFARLGSDLASIDFSNGHVTCSKLRIESQIPDKTEGSLLLPIQIPGATKSPNLHLLILDNSQHITLSDSGQHSTRLRCYFHHQCNFFIDYLNGPVLDGAVIYAGDIPLWYNEQEGTHT